MMRAICKFVISCAVVGCFLAGFVLANATEKEFVGTRLAKLVADYVHDRGVAEQGAVRDSDGNVSYGLKFYTAREVFLLNVREHKSGTRDLSIKRYLTKIDFSDIKTANDAIAQQLIWGRFKINIESHFYDDGADGNPEIYQEFTKKKGSTYEGFTREERDRGKKAGVSEYLYDTGRLTINGKRKKLSDAELKDILRSYVDALQAIADHFHLQ